jgi:nucleoid-associated protein YgaU
MMYVSECRSDMSIRERRAGTGGRSAAVRGERAPRGEGFTIMRYAAAMLFLVLVSVGFMIMGTGAAERTPAAPAPSESVVIVSAGETLWEIAAANKAEGMDTRRAVYEIKKRNGLDGSVIRAGQQLVIPDWSGR